jgi:outer membrane protein OmpA-like peptidoglycan-associated protein
MMSRLLPKILLGIGLMLLAACQTMADHGGWTRAQVAALRSGGFVKTDRGWEFGMQDRLLFATDASDIRAEQVGVIRNITARLVAVGIRRAQVEGHADDTGTARHNDALSVRRAAAVADAMAGGGMPRGNILVEGLGDRYPIESNATAQGRQENRRVVILIAAP